MGLSTDTSSLLDQILGWILSGFPSEESLAFMQHKHQEPDLQLSAWGLAPMEGSPGMWPSGGSEPPLASRLLGKQLP